MSRGGARKGSGRKRTGPQTILVSFSLTKATAQLLSAIPRGSRSAFIDSAIRQALQP